MAKSDYEIKQEYDDNYREAISYWDKTYEEMDTDLRYYLGNQWSDAQKKLLSEEQREAFVYNYGQRNIHLNSGYQRKNRLGFGIDAQTSQDEEVSDYLQDALIWQANSMNFYNTISDSFEDASITGLSMLTFGIDFSQDSNNGQIYVENEKFQQILLDPAFTKLDLSDCMYAQKRKYVSKEISKMFLPSAKKDIDKLPSGRIDNKFDYMSVSKNTMKDKDIVAYDEYYRRVFKAQKILTHRFTGQQIKWKGSKSELDDFLFQYPYFEVSSMQSPSIEYNVLIQGELMFSGDDPLGIDDYPCTPLMWVYKPQYHDFRYKMQGMMRPQRDPQSEYNMMRSKFADIIKSQANTGWVVEEGAVKNKEDLFKTGQGQVIETYKGKFQAIREKQSVEVPSSLINLVQLLSADMIQIPGLNEEALGVAEQGNTEISGTLAKQRTANAITIFQGAYDKLDMSQKICGQKLMKIMLNNFTPEKWEKITGKPMPQAMTEATTDDIMLYDIIVKEQLLTDSQRNLAYYQALEAKKIGVAIPDEFIIENMPIANKSRLKEMYQQQAQTQQQMQQSETQQQTIKNMAVLENLNADTGKKKAEKLSSIGLWIERQMEAKKDLEQATLDKIKAVKELQGMDLNQIQQALEIIANLKQKESDETLVPDQIPDQTPEQPGNALSKQFGEQAQAGVV